MTLAKTKIATQISSLFLTLILLLVLPMMVLGKNKKVSIPTWVFQEASSITTNTSKYITIKNNLVTSSATNLFVSTSTISGTYQGTVAITVPVQLGVLDIAFDISEVSGVLDGEVNLVRTLVYSPAPGLHGTFNSTTLTLSSDIFENTISGREVQRSFTLVGQAEQDGDILHGLYTEVITGFTPHPMTVEGIFMVTRPPAPRDLDALSSVMVQVKDMQLQTHASTPVTITLRDGRGEPFTETTRITMTSDLGTVTPSTADTDANGVVNATFTAGTLPGTATVFATTGALTGSKQVEIMAYAVDTMTLTASAPALSTNSRVTLNATVLDTTGQPAAGATVTFTGTLGTLAPLVATTDADGVATTAYIAGAMPGIAVVSATCEHLTDTVSLQVATPEVGQVSLEAGARTVTPTGQTSIIATIYNQFTQPLAGEVVSLIAAPGTITPDTGISNVNGQVTATFTASDLEGEATITALAGSASDSMVIKISTYIPGPSTIYLPLVLRGYHMNHMPYLPNTPTPPDKAMGQSLNVILTWRGGDPDGDAVTYDVYFWANDTTATMPLCANLTTTSCDPGSLALDTRYSWYVIATDAEGATVVGPVWTFTTTDTPNRSPYTPSDPTPLNGAADVSTNSILSWTGGDPDGDSVTYTVYLDAEDHTPDTVLCDMPVLTSCTPSLLDAGTSYYWQVTAVDSNNAIAQGPVWVFTTTLVTGWQEVGIGSASGGGISNNDQDSEEPAIAIGAEGTSYVVWHDWSNENTEIYVMYWNGSSWEEMGSQSASSGGISNNSGASQNPTIAVAPDGTPYIAWEDDSGGQANIYVRRWNGTDWEEVGIGSATGSGISDNDTTSANVAIAIAPDGTPYVTWQNYSGTEDEIYVRRWNGTIWEEVGTAAATGEGISNNSANSQYPAIAISLDNTPYIAWQDYGNGNPEIYVVRWNGMQWESVGANSASGGGISNNSGYSQYPKIATISNDSIYVTWQDGSSIDDEIYVRHWDGSQWNEVGTYSASEGGISDNSADSKEPSIAAISENNVYVTWHDRSGGLYEIYVRHWNGSDWEEVGASSAGGGGISNTGNTSKCAVIVLDGNNPYIVWQNDTAGDTEIYVKRWK